MSFSDYTIRINVITLFGTIHLNIWCELISQCHLTTYTMRNNKITSFGTIHLNIWYDIMTQCHLVT